MIDLNEVVEQNFSNPSVLGRLACFLRRNEPIAQRHHDHRELDVFWRHRDGHWRCTIFLNKGTDACLAQVDVHDDGTIRVEAYEPCSITISLGKELLCLTRLVK